MSDDYKEAIAVRDMPDRMRDHGGYGKCRICGELTAAPENFLCLKDAEAIITAYEKNSEQPEEPDQFGNIGGHPW